MRGTPPLDSREIQVGENRVLVQADGAVQIDGQPIEPGELSLNSPEGAAARGALDLLQAQRRAADGVKWVGSDGTLEF